MNQTRTLLACALGFGLLVIGTGLTGAEAALILGLALFTYNVAVLVSLAARDAILRLVELFDAWQAWEPDPPSESIDRSTNQILGRIN